MCCSIFRNSSLKSTVLNKITPSAYFEIVKNEHISFHLLSVMYLCYFYFWKIPISASVPCLFTCVRELSNRNLFSSFKITASPGGAGLAYFSLEGCFAVSPPRRGSEYTHRESSVCNLHTLSRRAKRRKRKQMLKVTLIFWTVFIRTNHVLRTMNSPDGARDINTVQMNQANIYL